MARRLTGNFLSSLCVPTKSRSYPYVKRKNKFSGKLETMSSGIVMKGKANEPNNTEYRVKTSSSFFTRVEKSVLYGYRNYAREAS